MKHRLVFLLAVIVALTYLLFLAVSATDRPSFCNSCHIMQPYYENWLNSSHNKVPCVSCHIRQGFRGYIEGKIRLMSEIFQYWTGLYNVQLHARIEDSRCLACHNPSTFMNKNLHFLGERIKFRHRLHLDPAKLKMKLSCQACHSQLVKGRHTAVTEETCINCHFLGKEIGEPLAGCGSCHGPPANDILVWGKRFNHMEYINAGVPCRTCHIHVTRGRGDVSSQACMNCHVQRFERMGDTSFIHLRHVTREKIRCVQCHESIQHGRIEMTPSLLLQCQDCHGNQHSVQADLYSGMGARDVPITPDLMFLGGVTCQGCHSLTMKDTPFGTTFDLPRASLHACEDCHGKGYQRIAKTWQKSVLTRLNTLEPLAAILHDDPAMVRDSSIIVQNLAFIRADQSLGVHNIRYTHIVLNHAEELIKSILKKFDVPDTFFPHAPPPEKVYIETPRCLDCHVGIEHLKVQVRHRSFPHGIHLVKFNCAKCHEFSEPGQKNHGQYKFMLHSCESCHHEGEIKDCSRCHKIQAMLYTGKLSGIQPDPMADADIGCLDCHITQGQKIIRPKEEVCLECHDETYVNDYKKNGERIHFLLNELENKFRKDFLTIKVTSPDTLRRRLELYSRFVLLKKENTSGAHNPQGYISMLERLQQSLTHDDLSSTDATNENKK